MRLTRSRALRPIIAVIVVIAETAKSIPIARPESLADHAPAAGCAISYVRVITTLFVFVTIAVVVAIALRGKRSA